MAWNNWTIMRHEQEKHHNLEQLDHQEAWAKGASWLEAIGLLRRITWKNHKEEEHHNLKQLGC